MSLLYRDGRAFGVLGVGSYLPDGVRTNEEIAATAGGTPNWISAITGVRRRHLLASGQASSDLAAEAVRSALDSAGLAAADLGLLILATSTPDQLMPSTACGVQALLGAKNAVALDVSAACAGWLFGVRIACDWLRTDSEARYAVVVGVEAFSPFVDVTDFPTATLFGDGAAATVLGPVAPEYGFAPIELGSDGTQSCDVSIPAGGSRQPPSADTVAEKLHFIHMDGRSARDFVFDVVPRLTEQALKRSHLTADDITLVITHQPNPILLREVCAQAGLPEERLVVIGDEVGNIGAGSLPYGLARAVADGRLKPGDRLLLIAFGAGATWGSTVLTWGPDLRSANGGGCGSAR
jgi:3-oxoacyl-[acyl-carrier-protein] synthase-3